MSATMCIQNNFSRSRQDYILIQIYLTELYVAEYKIAGNLQVSYCKNILAYAINFSSMSFKMQIFLPNLI